MNTAPLTPRCLLGAGHGGKLARHLGAFLAPHDAPLLAGLHVYS